MGCFVTISAGVSESSSRGYEESGRCARSSGIASCFRCGP